MGSISGLGREFGEASTDWVTLDNLAEFRGTIWEAVTDWFFGVTTVDYDWRESADKDRLTKWIYTQDGVAVSDHNVTVGKNELDIGLTAGPDPLSNQRDLFTIPETGSWGIAHAIVEVKSEAYSGALGILPQHGFGLRAQEDTKRRTIAVWHDVFVGNPHVINVGVWHGNLDGSGFDNRGGSATFDLRQTFNITAGTRSGGTVTATCTSHGLVIDDWINVAWTREFASVAVSRASNVVTATPGSGHGFQAGDVLAVGLSSPASFDGTFTITSVNATEVFWSQTGSNESGTGKLKDQASDVTQVQVTEIPDANTFKYVDGKHDLTSLGVSNGNNARNFPYWMEVKVSGTVVWVRCWSRHQSVPSWTQPNNAFNCDLEKAHTNYTVTASSRTSNIATLTIGAHEFAVGNRIDVDITDASFDTTNGFVTDFNATQVMYANTGTNDGDGGTGTCKLQGGSALASQIVDIPTPRGSGRIALVANHEGIVAKSHVSYGDITGTNSFESVISTAALVAEAETAQPAGHTKTRTAALVTETETAQPVIRGGAPIIQAVQTTTITTGSTSHVIDLDTLGLQDGDRVQVFASTGRNNLSPGTTWPGGWGELSDTTNIATSALTLSSAYLDIAGSPPTSVTITTVNNTECEAVAYRVTDYDPGTPPEVTTAIDTDDPPAITPSWGASFALFGTVICSEPASPTYPFPDHQATATGTNVEIRACATRTAGATVNPAAWSDIEAGLNVLTFAMRGVTAGGSTPVNQVTETETAQTVTAVKTRSVGQSAETETGTATTPARTLGAAQTAETETATVTGHSKLRSAGQPSETETATTTTAVKAATVLQPAETETATTPVRSKTLTATEATEVEAGYTVTAGKQLAAGQTAEVETATAPARLKSQIVVQVLETETAQVVTFTSGLSVGQSIETESAQPAQAAKTATAGLVSDLETAGTVSPAKVLLVGQPLEDETAQVVTVSDTTVAGQTIEAEIAAQLQAVKTLATGVAVDTEAAGAVTSVKALTVAQTVEAETATVATVLRVLAQAVELDAGLAFTSLKRLTLLHASEVETATGLVHQVPDPNPAHLAHTSGRSTIHATDSHVVAASGPSSTVTYQEGQ